MPNPLIFVDLPTPDPEATSRFYEELFEWKINRRPAGEFHEILPGVKPNLGMHREEQPVGPIPPSLRRRVADPAPHHRPALSLHGPLRGGKIPRGR